MERSAETPGLELAFHAIPDAVVLADSERRITYVNPSFSRLFGYTEDEVRGEHTKIIYESEDAYEEQGRQRFHLSAEEKLRPYEVNYRRKNGEVFRSETVGTIVKGADGDFIGFLGIIRDITDRKSLERELQDTLASLEGRVLERTAKLRDSARKLSAEIAEREKTEEALRQSEARFRTLFLAMDEGVCLHDVIVGESGKIENYRIIDVNPAYERTLGISATDAIGKLGTELYGTEEAPYLDVYSQVVETGKPTFFETYFPPMDRHFSISAIRPRPGSFATIFVDITARKRHDKELAEAMTQLEGEKARAESFLAAIGDGISIQDRQFRVLYQNAIHREMMGQHMGAFCFEAYEHRDSVCEGCPVARTFADGKIHMEERTVGAGEDARHYEITTSPLRGYDGEIVAGIEVVREITERKKALEERMNLERQVQHVQKLESLGVLAGGIAHDFNNILMSILGNADLALAQMSRSAPGREKLVAIEQASRRAADLCQQMLAYSGKGSFVLEPVDLSELVREMHHMLEVSISKSSVLRYNLPDNIPRVVADPTQVRQVIMNLIINASEAIGSRSGVISISTGAMDCDRSYLEDTFVVAGDLAEGLYVYFEVADTGCGMTEEVRKKLFDPFFTTKFTGRGLGMAAVLGIVRGHEGAIRVYSEEGKGTTIKVLLPAAGYGEQSPDTEEPPEQDKTPWTGSGTILLVDDEETVRAVAGDMLRYLGFTVLTAVDGQQALDVFKGHREEIACVLLDLTMPRMDGEQAFRELRRIDPGVRVIMSSGYNEQEVIQQFLGKGLAGFIQKPYQIVPLSEQLEKTLGGTDQNRE